MCFAWASQTRTSIAIVKSRGPAASDKRECDMFALRSRGRAFNPGAAADPYNIGTRFSLPVFTIPTCAIRQ
jgi:hypothetical protein